MVATGTTDVRRLGEYSLCTEVVLQSMMFANDKRCSCRLLQTSPCCRCSSRAPHQHELIGEGIVSGLLSPAPKPLRLSLLAIRTRSTCRSMQLPAGSSQFEPRTQRPWSSTCEVGQPIALPNRCFPSLDEGHSRLVQLASWSSTLPQSSAIQDRVHLAGMRSCY
jgi:hypothetical protein